MGDLLDDMARLLSEASAELAEAARGVEPEFIHVGEMLQQVFAEAQVIAWDATSSADRIGGSTGDGLAMTLSSAAKGSIEGLEESMGAIAEALANMESILEHLALLRRRVEDLRRIGRQLHVTTLFFSVESSRSPEVAQVFSSYVPELRKLAGEIGEVAETVDSDSMEAQKHQRAAREEIAADLEQLRRLVTAGRSSTVDALGRAEQIVASSLAALEQISEHSVRIAAGVGDIVEALQAHDITRQRIEHIGEALGRLERLCADRSEDGQSGENERTLSEAYCVMSLQVAQLRSVLQLLSRAHVSIQEALARILEETHGLASGAPGSSAQNGAMTAEGALGHLMESFRSLGSLLGQGDDLRVRADETAREAIRISGRLTGHAKKVFGISAAIKLRALNAVVSSARLGDEGRALSVLAGEAMAMSEVCNELVGEIVKALDAVAEMTSAETLLDADNEAQAASLAEMRSRIEQASAMRDEMLASAPETSLRVADLRLMILEVEQRIHFLPGFAAQLGAHLDRFDALLASLRPWRRDPGEEQGISEDQLLESYTMESEREIHSATIRQLAQPTVLPNIEVASPCDEGGVELGDNVELF